MSKNFGSIPAFGLYTAICVASNGLELKQPRRRRPRERHKFAFLTTNNIHEKISPFWLVKSSVVFFLKRCRKELIQCKKRRQTKYSDWAMIKETHRWPIKSFVFKSSARPGWRNWWRNFFLIAWYACVLHALHVRFYFCTLRSLSQPINDLCV